MFSIPAHITVEHISKHDPATERALGLITQALKTLIERIDKMVLPELQSLKNKADVLKASADRAEAKLVELKALVEQLQNSSSLSQEDRDLVTQIDEILTTEAGELDAGAA